MNFYYYCVHVCGSNCVSPVHSFSFALAFSVAEMRADEYGVEEQVTVLRPAPVEAYSKENVFVPPVLAKWLRPHQREGVQFMYECVMGLRDFAGNGCILADDMGLGKSKCSVGRLDMFQSRDCTQQCNNSSSLYVHTSHSCSLSSLTDPRQARLYNRSASSSPSSKRALPPARTRPVNASLSFVPAVSSRTGKMNSSSGSDLG